MTAVTAVSQNSGFTAVNRRIRVLPQKFAEFGFYCRKPQNSTIFSLFWANFGLILLIWRHFSSGGSNFSQPKNFSVQNFRRSNFSQLKYLHESCIRHSVLYLLQKYRRIEEICRSSTAYFGKFAAEILHILGNLPQKCRRIRYLFPLRYRRIWLKKSQLNRVLGLYCTKRVRASNFFFSRIILADPVR